MKIFHVCDNGYKYDRRIFWGVLGIALLLFSFTAYLEGFNFSYKFHFVCEDSICDNPYSDVMASRNSVTGHKYLCSEEWCKEPILTKGEYGKGPPWLLLNFNWILILMVIAGLILNHFIHNKGKIPSIKPNISDKHWNKIKKNFEESKDIGDDKE